MIEERRIRRVPAREKKISEIIPEVDLRVRLTGTVISVNDNSIILDDGSGNAEIIFDEKPNLKQGELVRVVTRIVPLLDGFQCRAECVQSLKDFDIDLYKKAKEIIKSL
jgi:hypothetical protein